MKGSRQLSAIGYQLRALKQTYSAFQPGARILQQQVVSGHHGNYGNGMMQGVEASLAPGCIKHEPSNGVRL
jgi:hypothetical protein